jgi:hypothetical protein
MEEGKLFYHHLDVGDAVRIEADLGPDADPGDQRFTLVVAGFDERIEIRDFTAAQLAALRQQIDLAVSSLAQQKPAPAGGERVTG